MYRAVTWLALRRAIDIHDAAALADMAQRAGIRITTPPLGSAEATAVELDGEDATPHLRDPGVEANVSLVSSVPGVRSALVRIQRALAAEGRIVMAGRDIGSVVLPDAPVKVYLDASTQVRARRRAEQLRAAGLETSEDAILADLTRRDGLDSTREASPLTAAAGAVIILTDDLTIEQVVGRILELARD